MSRISWADPSLFGDEEEDPSLSPSPEPIQQREAPDISIDNQDRYGIDQTGWKKAYDQAHTESMSAYWAKKAPFAGGIISAVELATLNDAKRRINRGDASQYDYNQIANFIAQREHDSDKNWMQWGGDIIAGLPGFMIEFALTAGTAAAIKQGVVRGATKGVATSMGTQFAAKAAGSGAALAARTAMIPGMYAPGTVERMSGLGDLQGGDDFVDLANLHTESLATALPKAFVSGMIEVGSETLGGKLAAGTSKRIPKAAKERLATIGAKVIPAWMAKTGRTIGEAVKYLDKFGFHGMLGEFEEERIAEWMRGGTDVAASVTGLDIGLDEGFGMTGEFTQAGVAKYQGDDEKAAMHLKAGTKQALAEGTAFAVPGPTMAAVSAGHRGRQRRERLEQQKEFKEQIAPADRRLVKIAQRLPNA